MKKLSEFDYITTPQDWIDDAINIEKKLKVMSLQEKEKEKKKTLSQKMIHKKIRKMTGRMAKTIIAAAIIVAIVGAGTITFIAAVKQNFAMSKAEEEINETSFVILLSGSDEYTDSTSTRSDVNILVAVNPTTKKLAVIATDRDSYVYIDNSDNDTYKNSGYDKLTYAGNLGMDTLKQTLENLYNCDIDYSSSVNFSTMPQLIDALGGISVYSDETFTTGSNASEISYTFTEGYNECDGAKALAFCRERQAFKDGSAARNRHQISVVEAVLDKMMTMDVMINYDEVTSVIGQMMQTDMTTETMIALIKGQYNCLADWEYSTYCVSGVTATKNGQVFGMTGMSVVIPDENSVVEATQMIQNVLNGEE